MVDTGLPLYTGEKNSQYNSKSKDGTGDWEFFWTLVLEGERKVPLRYQG